MRLIDNETLTLKEFFVDIPPYAILSHTWRPEGEVTFQEMSSLPTQTSPVNLKPGYEKIKKTCEIALAKYNLRYSWVDTCCIDKSSSTELGEAINSMYRWYQEAEVCLAYLEDVTDSAEAMPKSRWFTRGWTLQELIAPLKLVFFDTAWKVLGTRWDLEDMLFDITGITRGILQGIMPLEEIPVATRMSWASRRQTTRLEDSAYCLLGIFDINMPLLYGEGSKAFIRLQEEIIKQTADLSIFAWTDKKATHQRSGLLAQTPSVFGDCHSLHVNGEADFHVKDFSTTNRGIRIETLLVRNHLTGTAILPLGLNGDPDPSLPRKYSSLGIALRQFAPGFFLREYPNWHVPWVPSMNGEPETIHVAKITTEQQHATMKLHRLHIRDSPHVWMVESTGSWDHSNNTLHTGFRARSAAQIHFYLKEGDLRFHVIVLFRDKKWRIVLDSAGAPLEDYNLRFLMTGTFLTSRSAHMHKSFVDVYDRETRLDIKASLFNKEDEWTMEVQVSPS